MSKNAKPAATKPAEAAAAAPAKGNKKLVVVAALLVFAIAGGAGWYFTRDKSDNSHAEEVKVAAPQRPLFIPLEAFTVNLQKETADQYLQVGITLKFFDADLEEKIKTNLPEIRSKILLLLATKTASGLSSPEGKTHLIQEIIVLVNGVLGIVNKPAVAAAKPAAASQPAEAGTNAAHADAQPDTAHAPADAGEEKKGIIDVLFTSFIIQ